MKIKDQITREIDSFDERQLGQIAEYIAFLKFRKLVHPIPTSDNFPWADYYAEFAEEDLQLAEAGLNEYTESLSKEDK